MKAKRLRKSGSSEDNRRRQPGAAGGAATAAATPDRGGNAGPNSAGTSTRNQDEEDHVAATVAAAVRAHARGKAMAEAMEAKKRQEAMEAAAAAVAAAEAAARNAQEAVKPRPDDPDDDFNWIFDSINRYKHLCMYRLDALPLCVDVDTGKDQVALGVSRQITPAKDATKTGNAVKPPSPAFTYQLLILRIPDKISAKKTESQRDLSSNRDLKYLAGSDLGDKQGLRQVRFFDSETVFALQDYTLSCWTIPTGSDILSHTFSLHFDDVDGKMTDFRIAHNRTAIYLVFSNQCKIRKYRVYREGQQNHNPPKIEPGAAVAGDPSVIVASASTQPPPSSKSETPGSNPAGSASLGAVGGRLSECGPLRLALDPTWTKSNLHFKEGNLADLHDLWFWNTLFDASDVVRPALFVDGDPVGFEASRKMLGPEWGATNSPSGSPKMAWHYTPGRGLIGATVRLNDKPEAKMVTFRSQKCGRWDCWTATLGFTLEGAASGVVQGESNQNRPEVSVFPDLNHQDLFRVVVAAANNVYYYQVTPEHGIVEVFRHDSHKACVIRVAPYPNNPEVVFSVDTDMNVHVWWPDNKQLVFKQLPRITFPESSRGVVDYKVVTATAASTTDQPLDLQHPRQQQLNQQLPSSSAPSS